MKRLCTYLRIWAEDNKLQALALLGILNVFAMYEWTSLLRPTISNKWLVEFGDMVVILPFFLIGGFVGILFITKREAQIFIIPLQGIPAIILGLFLAVVGFGLVLWGLILHVPSLMSGLISWLQGSGIP